MECYDNELKKLVEEKEDMEKNYNQMNIDRTAKYKFLGAALILMNNMERVSRRTKLKSALKTWKYNQSVQKIAEKAFNKILELNHRHSQQRFGAACFLLEKSIGKTIKRDAFIMVQKFAMLSQLKHHRTKSGFGMSVRTS